MSMTEGLPYEVVHRILSLVSSEEMSQTITNRPLSAYPTSKQLATFALISRRFLNPALRLLYSSPISVTPLTMKPLWRQLVALDIESSRLITSLAINEMRLRSKDLLIDLLQRCIRLGSLSLHWSHDSNKSHPTDHNNNASIWDAILTTARNHATLHSFTWTGIHKNCSAGPNGYLSHIYAREIAQLMVLPSMRSMSISHTMISNYILPGAKFQPSPMISLSFSHCYLDSSFLDKIHFPSLSSLELTSTSGIEGAHLLKFLHACPSLRSLSMINRCVDLRRRDFFDERFTAAVANLHVLKIGGDGCRLQLPHELFQVLPQSLRELEVNLNHEDGKWGLNWLNSALFKALAREDQAMHLVHLGVVRVAIKRGWSEDSSGAVTTVGLSEDDDYRQECMYRARAKDVCVGLCATRKRKIPISVQFIAVPA